MSTKGSNIEISHDIRAVFEKHQVLDYFESLPPSHQKEYLNWINEAKKTDTRLIRLDKASKTLKEKMKKR